MKIGTRLTLLFTFITSSILLVFSMIVYLSAYENREKEFYALLKQEAITKANLFFDAKVDVQVLQDIYRLNREVINEVEVAIYDTAFNLLYHDAHDIDFVKETREMMDEIIEKGEIRFFQDAWQVIGLQYFHDGRLFIVTSAAFDGYGYNKLFSLRKTILLVLLSSIIITLAAGYFFSRNALKPIKEMTRKARRISATNLDLRLPVKGSRDELSELANTFNDMLERLEKSFEAQKHFVSHISHELRTPLAAIIGELDLTLSKKRTDDEYRKSIALALEDSRRLKKLSNSLLDLAKATYDTAEIQFNPIRIDELLLDSMQQVKSAWPGYTMDISFASDFDYEKQLSVIGNEYLLKVAFANLIENGCKFSGNNQVHTIVSFDEKCIKIEFIDNGPSIPEEEITRIFDPFFRGSNATAFEGNGIGLYLTQKIIHLHKGEISVISSIGNGTKFTVTLKNTMH